MLVASPGEDHCYMRDGHIVTKAIPFRHRFGFAHSTHHQAVQKVAAQLLFDLADGFGAGHFERTDYRSMTENQRINLIEVAIERNEGYIATTHVAVDDGRNQAGGAAGTQFLQHAGRGVALKTVAVTQVGGQQITVNEQIRYIVPVGGKLWRNGDFLNTQALVLHNNRFVDEAGQLMNDLSEANVF